MQKVIKVTESNAIRKKMMAATSMLLVAVIMLVSASYAWFTLSTAPEVTGINTTVGANGNLEMALANYGTWTGASEPSSAVGTSMTVADVDIANESWGNLVDVSDTTVYGLDKISLYPSRLNFTDAEFTTISTSSMLQTPVYGYDGRIDRLLANSVTGTYDGTGFVDDEGKDNGVRAIGVASSMTDRQIIYRNATSTIANKITEARKDARNTILDNGTGIADIIVKHATANPKGEETYDESEVTALLNAAKDMDAVVDILTDAWEASVVGILASATGEDIDGLTEEVVKVLQPVIESGNYTVSGESISIKVTVDDAETTYGPYDIGDLGTIYSSNIAPLATTVNTTISELEALTGNDIEWSSIRSAMAPLVDPDKVKVNDFAATDLTVKENLEKLISDVMGGKGISVQLPADSGAFADIAELCGDYSGDVTLRNLSYSGITVPDTTATMKTTVGVDETSCILGVARAAVVTAGNPSSESEVAAAITDYYGYAIDLLFRTNAANSDLLLQVDEAQRVYEDSQNELTQGGGTSMTFTPVQGFATADMIELMGAIRVVFVDNVGKVLSFAALDIDNTETTVDGTKADLKLCEHSVTGGVVTLGAFKEDQTLLENMTQNGIVKISAIVYLDGDVVDNSMVANGVQSMSGKLNLQFSSSATLNPMDNTALFEGAE